MSNYKQNQAVYETLRFHNALILLLLLLSFSSITTLAQSRSNADDRLLMASYEGKLDSVIHALIDSAHVNAISDEGITALMYAAQGGYTDIIKVLLHNGADPDIIPFDGKTALMSAASFGNLDAAEALIRSGATVDLKDINGATALMYAAAAGQFTMCDMLLYYDASINTHSRDSSTALMLGAYSGNVLVVGKLIEKGAEVDVRNSNGYSALSIAVLENFVDVADTLLSIGADPGSKIGDYNLRIIDVARIKNKRESFKILRKAGGHCTFWPFYEKITIGIIPADFNFHDYMIGVYIGIFDTKYNTSWNFGLNGRPSTKKILEPVTNGYYMQLREKRIDLFLSFDKLFNLHLRNFNYRFGPFITLTSYYTFGSYRGLSRKVDDEFLFVPGAGFGLISDNFDLRLRYKYVDFGTNKVSPHRVELSYGLFIKTRNSRKVNFNYSWL